MLDMLERHVPATCEKFADEDQRFIAVALHHGGGIDEQIVEDGPHPLAGRWSQFDVDPASVNLVAHPARKASLFEPVDDRRNGAGRQAGCAGELTSRQWTELAQHLDAEQIGAVDAELVCDCLAEGIDGIVQPAQRGLNLANEIRTGTDSLT